MQMSREFRVSVKSGLGREYNIAGKVCYPRDYSEMGQYKILCGTPHFNGGASRERGIPASPTDTMEAITGRKVF